MTVPSSRHSGSAAPGDQFWPPFAVGGLLFLLIDLGLVLLVTRVIGPAVLSAAPIDNLQSAVSEVTTLFAACSLAAGFVAAIVASWIATRGADARQGAVFLGAVTGPMAAAVAVVILAWLPRESGHVTVTAATPLSSTVANVSLTIIGAALGSFLVLLIRRRPPPGTVSAATTVVACIAVLILCSATTLPAYADSGPHQDIERQECTLSSLEGSVTTSLTLFSIDLGPSFSFNESRTADNRWHVDVAEGGVGGITLSFGEKLPGKTFGASLDVSASSHLTLKITNSYDYKTRAEATAQIRRASVLYLAEIAALPGASEILRSTLGDIDTPVSTGFKPRAPVKSEVDLAGEVSLEAVLGSTDYKLELTAGNAVSVELKSDSKEQPESHLGSGTPFVSDPSEFTVGLDLNAALLARAAAGVEINGKGELRLAIAKSKDTLLGQNVWEPNSIELSSEAEVTRGAQAGSNLEGIKSILGTGTTATKGGETVGQTGAERAFLKELNLHLGAGRGAVIEAALSTKGFQNHPLTFAAFAEFVAAIAPDFQGKKADSALVRGASKDLARTFAREADASITGDALVKTEGEFEVSVGRGITFGGSNKPGLVLEELFNALYRTRGIHLAQSAECVPRNEHL